MNNAWSGMVSHGLLALPFIAILFFIGSYKQYERALNPLRTSIIALFFLMPLPLHFINYEQPNALPSTFLLCK